MIITMHAQFNLLLKNIVFMSYLLRASPMHTNLYEDIKLIQARSIFN